MRTLQECRTSGYIPELGDERHCANVTGGVCGGRSMTYDLCSLARMRFA